MVLLHQVLRQGVGGRFVVTDSRDRFIVREAVAAADADRVPAAAPVPAPVIWIYMGSPVLTTGAPGFKPAVSSYT